MSGDLTPIDVATAARRLAVPPTELVRFCVLAGRVPARWAFDAEALPELAAEAGWVRLLPTPAPAGLDAQLRAAVEALREGDHRDGRFIRADALWRGLSAPDAEALEQAVTRLIAAGLLLRQPGIEPVAVCIPREAEDKLATLAAGEAVLDDLVPQ